MSFSCCKGKETAGNKSEKHQIFGIYIGGSDPRTAPAEKTAACRLLFIRIVIRRNL
jgi:hypothetical protein